MGSFMKGMTFTMEGVEYEVVGEGTSEPSSCMTYVPSAERDTADPMTIRVWKAEAKLARGDIMISGYIDDPQNNENNGLPILDPLAQIAELKKRIHAIEQRRLSLLKIDDPKGQILLQDNVIRPNKTFDLWDYTKASGDFVKRSCKIQYIKMRGIILVISCLSRTERFLFNISEQLQPRCRISGDSLISEGGIRIDLTPQIQTAQGTRTRILTDGLKGRIELGIELRLNCKFDTGIMAINAKITNAAYIREVNAPGLKLNHLDYPEIGDHMIAIEGIGVEIYTNGNDE